LGERKAGDEAIHSLFARRRRIASLALAKCKFTLMDMTYQL